MRKLIIAVVVLGVLAAAAYGGRRGYRVWKVHKGLGNAREAIQKGKYNDALLWLRKVLASDGNNLEAVRLMGDFSEAAGMPVALDWRKRLLELEPDSVTNRLMLARVGIVHGDFASAEKALNGVSESESRSPDFHKAAAALAVATGRLPEAEAHYQKVLLLDPDDPVAQVNLAMILIQRPDLEVAARGRAMLENLREVPAARVNALRQLAFDAFRQTNAAVALDLAEQLVLENNSDFTDRLLHLNLLVAQRSPELAPRLKEYQGGAVTNAQAVFQLSRWMLGTRGAQETLEWLRSVPSTITTNVPVTFVLADTYQGLTNWPGLQKHVASQQWGELDFLRLAYLSRSLREQGFSAAAKGEWSKALKTAEARLDSLRSLERAAVDWGWWQESEEVLEVIVSRFPGEMGALQALVDRLFIAGKTRSLLSAYARASQHHPQNLKLKNNLASLALLLGAEEHDPHTVAREVYERDRENPLHISTYAYSLYLQKKVEEGLRLMDKLKSEVLEQPHISGYYGLLLASAGKTQEAGKYLDLAIAARLLPEEIALFQRVKDRELGGQL